MKCPDEADAATKEFDPPRKGGLQKGCRAEFQPAEEGLMRKSIATVL